MTRALLAAAALLACCATAGRGGEWVPVPAVVESVGEDTYASFAPVWTTRILVEGARLREKEVRAWSVDGRIEKLEAEESPRGTLLRFPERCGVGELVLLGVRAPKLRVWAPAAEAAPRKPPAPAELEPLGGFKITYYWVALEDEPGKEPADTPLLDPEGRELGRFTRGYVKRVGIEGTGKLRDGRVINVAGKKGAFEVVRCPNGLGVQGYHLLPFRSVAVDRDVVPIGTELYVPAAVGAKLPDGSVHDGRFWAHDVGGAINGKHLDLFTGAGDRSAGLEQAGVRNLRETEVYRVQAAR